MTITSIIVIITIPTGPSEKIFFDINNNRKLIGIPKNETERSGRWEQSMEICKKYGASLIAIESKEKQFMFEAFIRQFLTISGIYGFWTSGYRDSNGTLKWMGNGNEISYANWLKGQPDNAERNQNCIMIASYAPYQYYKWHDYYCHATSNIVCEYSF